VNVVVPLQGANSRARQTVIDSRSVILKPGGASEVLSRSVLVSGRGRSGNGGGVRGWPGGPFRIRFRTPRGRSGSYDRPGSLVSAVSADQGGCRDGGVPSMCPRQRFTAVPNGQQRSTVGAADLLPCPIAGWATGASQAHGDYTSSRVPGLLRSTRFRSAARW
jgi:hypothetical protein